MLNEETLNYIDARLQHSLENLTDALHRRSEFKVST
jgi:hypothetical protein